MPIEPPPSSVTVHSREKASIAGQVERIERRGKAVVLGHLTPEELDSFQPIDPVQIPPGEAYVVEGIDIGADYRNVTPEQALKQILEAGRSPLTLDEGIAVMLQQPGVIAKGWGFSMAGSRAGDQRVPAFWISDGKPKLGWCWDRNPHTWLGTASCDRRRPLQ